MSEEGTPLKLHMKVRCSICLGGVRKGVFTNCPYCDQERFTYIEASFQYVCSYIKQLEAPQQKQIIELLQSDDIKS